MKVMKLKKINVLIVISTLVITSIGVVINNDDTLATPDPEDITFDYQLIYNVTKFLSWRINESYNIENGELAKGRDYGSTGEHDSAYYIERIMKNLSLYAPNLDNNTYHPYLQQIIDGQEYFPIFNYTYPVTNDYLEILYKKFTLHNLSANGTANEFIGIPECHITAEIGNATFPGLYPNFDYDNLTKNFTYTDLSIRPFSIISWSFLDDFFNDTFTQDFFYNLSNNHTLFEEDAFDEYIISLFEQYYDFTFEEIFENPENASDLPWYNETLFNSNFSYVFLDEYANFNPNLSSMPLFDFFKNSINFIYNVFLNSSFGIDFEVNGLQPWITGFIIPVRQKFITWCCYATYWQPLSILKPCKGIILYDYNNDSYNIPNSNFAVPIIYINRTLGKQLEENSNDYRINITLNQSWNENMESYNVIGQINGSDPDPNKTILIECLYDSVWCQGTGDSAIGVGMVLALAKNMKQLENLSIKPKYNVRFVLFGGEERGARGAFYYEITLPENHTVKTVIDLNQLGFEQRDPPVPLIMNVATNKILLKPILEHITNITSYKERKNDGTEFKLTWTPIGSVSDEIAFANPFTGRLKTQTVMFLKDFNWTRHHRDGENHSKGDTMDYYDQDDIELTLEMIWNATRFFAMKPDSYFENYYYDYTDINNDNVDDTVNVSFNIKSVLPEDKVTVRLMLVPMYVFNPLHPGYSILYRYRTEKEFIITPQGTNGYIQLQLPKGAPFTAYRAILVLLNSTGDTYVDCIGKGAILSKVFENLKFDDLFEFFKDNFDIDCEETLTQNSDEIQSDFHWDITEFLERYPHLEDIQDLIQDLFAIYIFNDDKASDIKVLAPPNNPPDQPITPQGPLCVMVNQVNEYNTSSIDPDDDQVEFKWRFHLGDLIFNYNKWSAPYDSGEIHTQSNAWGLPGIYRVSVVARDEWHSPNLHSPRSEPLDVLVLRSSWIEAPSEQLVGKEVQLNGYLCGAEPYELDWDVGLSQGWQYKNMSNLNISYGNESNYTIILKIIDGQQNQYLCTKNVEIKYLISNFSGSSGNTNETLWFNDTSYNCTDYEATNWTWDFDDGTIVYMQNVNHTFLESGVYNVSLTVRNDEKECIDEFHQMIYIENDPPVVLDVTSAPIRAARNQTVMLYADVIDSAAGIKTVMLNITLPDASWQVINMEPSENGSVDYDYDYIIGFNDTEQLGEYFYTITVEDNAGNSVHYGGFSFTVSALAFEPSTPYSGTHSYSTIPVDVSSSILVSQHYAFTSLDNDVVIWMPMDLTTTGENPNDVSGYENNGVCHGGAGQTENGFFGKGFLFDGVDDYIEINTSSSLVFNTSQATTWSFWVRPVFSTMNTTMGMFSKSSSASNGSGFNLCLNTTMDTATFVIGAPENGVMQYSTSINLSLHNNSWAYLTVVYNGSSTWMVYQNGSYLGSILFPVVSNLNASYLLGAGRNATSDTVNLFFKGTLDDIVMIRRVLDPDEIHSLFNASEYPYTHNFTDVTDGTHNFTGFAGYLGGFANRTETRSITIDTQPPSISNVSTSPEIVGFGKDILLNTMIIENGSGLLLVTVNISYPDASWRNSSMTSAGENVYQYNFSDTWLTGQYNYTIWAVDNAFNMKISTEDHFHVSANATISITTLQDNYNGTQYINITDPPNLPENLTLINQGLTWDTYYNAVNGQNILKVSTAPINYQQNNGTWTPINTTIHQLTTNHPAYPYGYRAGNNHGLYGVYFKPNAQNEWPVAFTYNRSENPTTQVIRSKLLGVGYVDPASNWSYQYLQGVQSSMGQTNGNSITYEDVFTGTDVTWSYGNTGLKEEIILSNQTKTVLQNHSPSQYGLNNNSSYLVFITRFEAPGLTLYNLTGNLIGNVTVSQGKIEFRNTLLNTLKSILPIGNAYQVMDESLRHRLTYRILQYNEKYYLLSGLPVSTLLNMSFPVIIDPTLQVDVTANDGYCHVQDTKYDTAWSLGDGEVIDTDDDILIGQKNTTMDPTEYLMYRGYLFFNTTALPSNAVITNATLLVHKAADYSSTDFDLIIQNGQPEYPHTPLESGDYNKDLYEGKGGILNTANFINGFNNIIITNHSWVTAEGITKFCLRSNRDNGGVEPTGNEYVSLHASEFLGFGCHSILEIVYRNQSKIKNTGSTDIKGYLLIQVQFYNASQGKWLVDNDTINETSPRTITSGNQLALDLIFNGHVRASNLTHGTGTYRVYATFRDPEGNILKTDDDVGLTAWWQFNKT